MSQRPAHDIMVSAHWVRLEVDGQVLYLREVVGTPRGSVSGGERIGGIDENVYWLSRRGVVKPPIVRAELWHLAEGEARDGVEIDAGQSTMASASNDVEGGTPTVTRCSISI
jgi:hypothetical protein